VNRSQSDTTEPNQDHTSEHDPGFACALAASFSLAVVSPQGIHGNVAHVRHFLIPLTMFVHWAFPELNLLSLGLP
jgi:hypothetical protein